MPGCCDPSGYRRVFSADQATKAVRAFERKGLDGTAGAMIVALRAEGIDGATVLEVGAGPGTALVTLLEAGASHAVAFDISPSYEKVAGALLQGRGLADRVEWHTGDYLAALDVRPADIVFANRVVCCYPDLVPLVNALADRARRLVALSYPRKRWFTRSGVRMLNGYLRLRRVPFRVFAHDPMVIAGEVVAAGFESIASGGGGTWIWQVWRRVDPT